MKLTKKFTLNKIPRILKHCEVNAWFLNIMDYIVVKYYIILHNIYDIIHFYYIIFKIITFFYIFTGDTKTLFSPEDTVSCCQGFHCNFSMGCNGGQPSGAWNWFQKIGKKNRFLILIASRSIIMFTNDSVFTFSI